MDSITSVLIAWKTAIGDAFVGLAANLPAALAAILIVVAGWLVARLARRAAHRLSDGTHRLLDRAMRHGTESSSRLSRPLITVAGEIAFWCVLLLALIAAAGVAGLQSVTSWLNALIVHLPNVIVGIAIAIAGYLTSVYLREWVGASATRNAIEPSAAIGRAVQWLVFGVALIVGLDQIGIDVALLIVAFAVLAGAVVTGLMVAFAIGARDHVANLIGARHAKSVLKTGLWVRIGDVEGEIVELSATHIGIDAGEGRLLLPARVADTDTILILTAPPQHGHGHDKS